MSDWMSYGVACLYPSLDSAKCADEQLLKPVWCGGKIVSQAYVAMFAETRGPLLHFGERGSLPYD
jgi:hypothetical protein